MSSLATPKQIFEQLSVSQRRFLLEKTMTDTKTVREWLEFLQPIVAYDAMIDSATARLKVSLRFLLAMAAFNLLVAVVIQNLWVGLLGMTMAGLAVYQWTSRLAISKRDLSNHLRKFFYPLLASFRDVLDEDLELQASFHLREKDESPVIIDARGAAGEVDFEIALKKDAYQVVINGTPSIKPLMTPGEFIRQVISAITE